VALRAAVCSSRRSKDQAEATAAAAAAAVAIPYTPAMNNGVNPDSSDDLQSNRKPLTVVGILRLD
jgi:hypothetical protein